MKILVLSPEVAPFAQAGGLADAVAGLSLALGHLGHEVIVGLPAYRQVWEQLTNPKPVPDVHIKAEIGGVQHLGKLHTARFPNSTTKLLLVDCRTFYDRPGLYKNPGEPDYRDTLPRYVFYCQSMIQAIAQKVFVPDIIHAHNWQAALVPAYIRTIYSQTDPFKDIKTVFTIHDLAYQGFFSQSDLPLTGLNWDVFNIDGVEFYGDLNLTKGGIQYSDWVTSVSTHYAQEICTHEGGFGLDGVLRAKSNRLRGILNGIDADRWNPASDPHLPANFSAKDLSGKSACKQALQKKYNLPIKPRVPLLAMGGRLGPEQGLELLPETLEHLMLSFDVQFILAGAVTKTCQHQFQDLQCLKNSYPDRISLSVCEDESLDPLLLAGADFMLFPYFVEPCGLGQMVCLRYGTLPIARHTGGLADVVSDYNSLTGQGNGFIFSGNSSHNFFNAIRRGMEVYQHRAPWETLQKAVMAMDYSWDITARKYEQLFQDLLG